VAEVLHSPLQSTHFCYDLPAELWHIDRDRYSLLSLSHQTPMFALNVRSTRHEGWDDFLLELAEFAAHFRSIPMFNQTCSFKQNYARRAYGDRLMQFKTMRQRLDPEGRLLNQFYAEHIG
jgi:hypothetical protein